MPTGPSEYSSEVPNTSEHIVIDDGATPLQGVQEACDPAVPLGAVAKTAEQKHDDTSNKAAGLFPEPTSRSRNDSYESESSFLTEATTLQGARSFESEISKKDFTRPTSVSPLPGNRPDNGHSQIPDLTELRQDPNAEMPARINQPSADGGLPASTSPKKRSRSSHSNSSNESNAASSEEDCFSTASAELRFDDHLREEISTKWILTLSMHFKDGTRREKFFITYFPQPNIWMRISVSVDYSRPAVREPISSSGSEKMDTDSKDGADAKNKKKRSRSARSSLHNRVLDEGTRLPPEKGSLEEDLSTLTFQRDKNFCIFKAVYNSLEEIRFFKTITNLKLETIDERLHIHVAEDANERIQYPPLSNLNHLHFRLNNYMVVPENEVFFDAHLSGFVYRVKVRDRIYVKKEITSIDTVQEFLYEIEALANLKASRYVINLVGVVIGGSQDNPLIVGVLLEWASGGALNDFFYENDDRDLPWSTKMTWIRQVVQGLADIHEAGYVQGDCTLSNVVLDGEENAKIVDINRRGCPIGWEPPEFRGMIQSGQRISMFIGVKSDLYQMGMVIWAIANQIEEPDRADRPLQLDEDDVPDELREVFNSCISEDPRNRKSAEELLTILKPSDQYSRKIMGIKDMTENQPTREDIRASRKRFYTRLSRGGSEVSDIKEHFNPTAEQQAVEADPLLFVAGDLGQVDLERPTLPENVFAADEALAGLGALDEPDDMDVDDAEDSEDGLGNFERRHSVQAGPFGRSFDPHDTGLGEDMQEPLHPRSSHPAAKRVESGFVEGDEGELGSMEHRGENC